MPEMIAVRAGAHTGYVDQACLYLIPPAAKVSRFGVSACTSPYAPKCGPLSSDVNHRMFGRPQDHGPTQHNTAAIDNPIHFVRT